MPVTFEPILPLTVFAPVPAPLLMIVPLWLTLPERIILPDPGAFKAKLLLPVMLPESVKV